MRTCAGPARRLVCRFDGVADVFAVALSNVCQPDACGAVDGAAIGAIGSGLLAANVQFGRAVNGWRTAWSQCGNGGRRNGAGWQVGSSIFAARGQILEHSLPATFSAKPGLTVATKSTSSVKLVGGVDPDHAGLDLRRHIQRQTDRL